MVYTRELSFSTRGTCDIVDITDEVSAVLAASGISDGGVTVFVPGSTAGITTVEYEPGLVEDLKRTFERLAPVGEEYAHNRTWGDGNGFSHVRAALTGPGRTFPAAGGRLLLGTWQQIVLIDFDARPRNRKVVVQVSGEAEEGR